MPVALCWVSGCSSIRRRRERQGPHLFRHCRHRHQPLRVRPGVCGGRCGAGDDPPDSPSTALLQAWAAVPPEARALLELFLDAPAIVVEDLGVLVAAQADVRAHPAQQAGGVDVAAAHAVEVAIARGLAILTAEPGPLRAIDPDVEIEELPAV